MRVPLLMTLKLCLFTLACGDSTQNSQNATEAGAYASCPQEDDVGGFDVTLEETFTAVQGAVASAVRPNFVPEVTLSDGPCELLEPKNLFCDPMCGAGETCGDDGSCVPLPSNQSVGIVRIEGLSAEIEMEARAPVFFYNHVGELPHPALQRGDAIVLLAAPEDLAPFSMATIGIDPLDVTTQSLALAHDSGASLYWTPGSGHEAVAMEIELNIANHGGTPARVQCVTSDVGQFEIPSSMINALLNMGYSGFPSVTLTRAASNIAQIEYGCVAFRTQSRVVIPVEIPGLISCSNDNDCPTAQTCQVDLTCA